MKIAIASLYLPSGSKIGVGYQVHYLANALVGRGHDVTVFSQTGASEDSHYRVQVVPPRRRLRTFLFAWDLRRIDFTGFDVLNAHGDDWFLWGTRRPRHVHTYHGSCLAEMLHARTMIDRARMGALALCETQSVLLVDETVAVSESTRRYIPGIKYVIPCGVDTAAFAPGDEKTDVPTILFVGEMIGRKRGLMLLEMFRKIRDKIPGAQLWCVCGPPPGASNGNGVTFFGRVGKQILTDLYRRAWVFCLPSSYEGFGVPYIEAMSAGTPVVASPNVGAIEVTGNGKFGLISTDEELPATLIKMLEDSALRDRLRTAGLERSRDFSWDSVCSRYESLYVAGGAASGALQMNLPAKRETSV